MKKILTVVGARPQFIKSAPLSQQLRKHFQEVLVHTGQHYDENMSQQFFDELQIPQPDYNLEVGSGNHGRQTAAMLAGIETLLLELAPALVVVYGDTNSTLAGALAAAKLHIPVAHVEAGLRSFDRRMPEEQNRIVADHLSDLLFCPTQTAVENLHAENLKEGVHLTGDIMYDSVLRNLDLAEQKTCSAKLLERLAPGFSVGQYCLVTIHRAENTADAERVEEILTAVNDLPLPSLLPVHPRIAPLIDRGRYPNISFVSPLGYFAMLLLTRDAACVITDSGGLQKEAFFLGTRCLTIRSATEWVETLENGCNQLVPDVGKLAVAFAADCSWSGVHYFGDGQAAIKMTELIREFLR